MKITFRILFPFSLIAFFFLLPTLLFAQMEWISATDSAGWSPRYGHTSVVFDNKIWVLGGYDQSPLVNDVWYSNDGVNWTQATNSAAWRGREDHKSVVFDNKIWVLGGRIGLTPYNDVWFSSDGMNWNQATASAGWSARYDHTSVVFNNKIWVIGGFPFSSDVWYSNEGKNWTQAIASAPWAGRMGHTSVVFDNKIWVIGGFDYPGYYRCWNDVWYSSDGVNWTRACSTAEWSARVQHASVDFDDKIWVFGGWDGSWENDVWYSKDGVDWRQTTDSSHWTARCSHTSVVFGSKMWVLGGNDSLHLMNDIWYSISLGIEEGYSSPNGERLTPEIYPNPAKDVILVRYASDIKGRNEIKIFDVSGKLIKVLAVISAQENKQEMKISLKGIDPGIYFVQLGNELETKKLVITK